MYTKLANSILTSTVWMESNETRIVWLTLLAMCDKNGEVQASIPGLANVARVTVQECETAIQLFLSPDPYSRTKSDGGRRLEEIDGGWFVINHNKYRDLASDSDIKRKAAERQRRYRERQKRHGESVTEGVTSVTGCDKSRQISHTDTDTNADTATDSDTKEEFLCIGILPTDTDLPKQSKRSSVQRNPPSADEVRRYMADQGYADDAEAFVDFYGANGWVQGRGKPIKDWKAAVRNWQRNDFGKPQQRDKPTLKTFEELGT